MAVNWLQNRLTTNKGLLDPVLFFRSVVTTVEGAVHVLRATNYFNLSPQQCCVVSSGVMLRVLLPALATCCATNSVLQVAGKCC